MHQSFRILSFRQIRMAEYIDKHTMFVCVCASPILYNQSNCGLDTVYTDFSVLKLLLLSALLSIFKEQFIVQAICRNEKRHRHTNKKMHVWAHINRFAFHKQLYGILFLFLFSSFLFWFDKFTKKKSQALFIWIVSTNIIFHKCIIFNFWGVCKPLLHVRCEYLVFRMYVVCYMRDICGMCGNQHARHVRHSSDMCGKLLSDLNESNAIMTKQILCWYKRPGDIFVTLTCKFILVIVLRPR